MPRVYTAGYVSILAPLCLAKFFHYMSAGGQIIAGYYLYLLSQLCLGPPVYHFRVIRTDENSPPWEKRCLWLLSKKPNTQPRHLFFLQCGNILLQVRPGVTLFALGLKKIGNESEIQLAGKIIYVYQIYIGLFVFGEKNFKWKVKIHCCNSRNSTAVS